MLTGQQSDRIHAARKATAIGCALVGFLAGQVQAGVTTLSADRLTPNAARLNGNLEPAEEYTAVWFEWGQDGNYGHTTPPHGLASSTNEQHFSESITGLSVSVAYQFRAVASNSFGIVTGTNQNFVTTVFSAVSLDLPGASDGLVGWGDYDNDGRLDMLLSGYIPTQVWRNTGTEFSNINANLPYVSVETACWVDFDNDGRLDIGSAGGNWRNTGSNYAAADTVPFSNYYASAMWSDFNNDGLADMAFFGYEDTDPVIQIWLNFGNRFLNGNYPFPAVYFGTVASADFDGDGLMDLSLAGSAITYPATNLVHVWRNTGKDFVLAHSNISGIQFGSLAWGDYDNDGRLDLALSGFAGLSAITQIWRNTGTGFTNINAGLPGLGEGAVAWGDYDNDGRLDILLTGRGNDYSGNFTSDIWRNTSNGFVRANVRLAPICCGDVAWGDYDNDGRLDILQTGLTNDSGTWYAYSQLWHNEFPATNTPPLPPTNLSATLDGNLIVFHWGTGSDAETPASGLTYNLRVGTTPGGIDLVAPMSLSNGFRQVPRMGNVQQAHHFKLTRVPLNQPIYWSVQSVDTAFAGSAFAPEQNFRINASPGNAPGPAAGDLNGDGRVDETDLRTMLKIRFTNSPPPVIFVTAPTTNQFRLPFPNLAPLNFTVLGSTNLLEWETVGPAMPFFDFVDPEATNFGQRYYQLQLP